MSLERINFDSSGDSEFLEAIESSNHLLFARVMHAIAFGVLLHALFEIIYRFQTHSFLMPATLTAIPMGLFFNFVGYGVSSGYLVKKLSLEKVFIAMSIAGAAFLTFRMLTMGGMKSMTSMYFILAPLLASNFIQRKYFFPIFLFLCVSYSTGLVVQHFDLLGVNFTYADFPIYFEWIDATCCTGIIYYFSVIHDKERHNLKAKIQQQQLNLVQSSKMASLGTMAAGVAHEINNPLCIIEGAARSLKRFEGGEKSTESNSDAIDKILRTTKRISRIVEALKKYSKQSDDGAREIVDVRKIAKEAVDHCRGLDKDRKIEFRFEGFEELSLVEIKASEVAQVFISLISNSIEAVSEATQPRIEIAIANSYSRLRVTITDNGRGIDSKHQAQVLDPFFTTKSRESASGIGLSLSKGVIEAHGGTLTFTSLPGRTRFVFDLPLAILDEEQLKVPA